MRYWLMKSEPGEFSIDDLVVPLSASAQKPALQAAKHQYFDLGFLSQAFERLQQMSHAVRCSRLAVRRRRDLDGKDAVTAIEETDAFLWL